MVLPGGGPCHGVGKQPGQVAQPVNALGPGMLAVFEEQHGGGGHRVRGGSLPRRWSGVHAGRVLKRRASQAFLCKGSRGD